MQNVSFAERLLYGRAEDPEVDPPVIFVATRPGTALAARLLLAAIFVISGIAKIADPVGTMGHMRDAGIPYADVLIWVAAAAELTGAALLIAGLFTRVGALMLIAFLIPTTLIFHHFWDLAMPEQLTQSVNFLKNLAIIGGLSALVAYGAGRYSLDYLLRRPMQP
jgi:putative oxidoreductase